MTKKGFTIVELLVVMVVVGILTALAIPKYMGFQAEANILNIQHNVKAVEDKLAEEIATKGSLPYSWEISNESDIQTAKSEGEIYTIKGLFGDTEELPNQLVKVTLSDLGLKSNLKGVFNTTPEGNVYYVHKTGSGEEPKGPVEEPELPDGYVLATDEDFEYVESGQAPNAYENGVKGYYKYTGTDKYVTIPHTINGNEIIDYFMMFMNSSVEGVASNNSKVTNMGGMFGNSQATTLDLSSFDTSNVTDMSGMFNASQATTLDLSSFDTSNVTDMSTMFAYSQAITLDLSSLDTANVIDMSTMFYGGQATTLDLSSFDTANVTDMNNMFNASQATTLDLSSFDTSNVIRMRGMFEYSQATTLDLSSFDISKVTDMSRMFNGSKATTLDLSSFDTSNVISMGGMFYHSQATTLDLSSFDTANVTDMNNMFNASQATTLDLSSFDTSNVIRMRGMFEYSQATTLDLSSFDISKVTDMSRMFNGSKATTGYARTQADADKLNASSKPSALTFIVK